MEMEMAYLNELFHEHTKVRVIIINGYQLVGYIDDVSEHAIILDTNGKRKLVFISAISTVEPA